ncbi:short-chain dehydrogenase [Aspergillus arachidicola]|uniref:Short-chain dehydrogenase n=1 Tax=Aspergillus arachidicola TaxID=656916 RepID=A0A2G7G1H3_9EURO|nr:short-chain dehydrogenase [Aspergillus arachidicola]
MSPKTFIVTGASRGPEELTRLSHGIGIGLAISKFLLTGPQSHNVVVIARSVEPLQKLKDHLEVVRALDGLVLNHGVLGQVGKIAEADPEQWKQGFNINFISLVAFVKAGLPALRESKGRIVFTSSAAAISAFKGWGLYGASKAAMNHLALSLSEEEPDVTSVSVQPGLVDTEMQREIREDHAATLDPQFHAIFTTVHKDGGLLKPEQPGHVLARLVIDAPNSLSGKYLA